MGSGGGGAVGGGVGGAVGGGVGGVPPGAIVPLPPPPTGIPPGMAGSLSDPRFHRSTPKTPPRKKCEHCEALNPTARQFCV